MVRRNGIPPAVDTASLGKKNRRREPSADSYNESKLHKPLLEAAAGNYILGEIDSGVSPTIGDELYPELVKRLHKPLKVKTEENSSFDETSGSTRSRVCST